MWRSLEKESNEVYAGEALEHAKLVPADLTVLHPEYVQAKKSNLNYEMAKIHWSFALEIGVEGEGTPSIHNAAVKAMTKGASKAGQTELAMETVKLFDCSTISRMIKERSPPTPSHLGLQWNPILHSAIMSTNKREWR
ncbi:uncharacterized protein EI90DRAFT_3021955 [Cantharellus anzutake]|uniref:uncharacterized protein n=1 Tax=Cantharellus anzutake TaxID=1750568 RepID=UPI0019044B49|nr:uncharacterized protein EI90DRAFT_3021955 [Cantharellus anzutake]KAF8315303.1 hypothetical protein EI90DRAFT_3021955 [Cantharellus anzutake]